MSYTISFDSQGANNIGTTSISVEYGQELPSIIIPSKIGYSFCGYFTEINNQGTQYYNLLGEGMQIWDFEEDKILYAGWVSNNPYKYEYTQGVFDNYLRATVFEIFKDSNRYTNRDFIGYVNKDVESLLGK